MDIIEQEFTYLARMRATRGQRIDNDAVVLYLFLARLGMKAERFNALEATRSTLEQQGLTRYRLNKSIRALCAAGLLQYEAGGGRAASRYTLPRLLDVRMSAEQPQPLAQAAPYAVGPMVSAAVVREAPQPAPAGVTPDEALGVMAERSATVQRLCEGVVTPAVKETLVEQFPRMGYTRADILKTLAAIAAAVEESDYLKANVQLGWLVGKGNWEKVVNGTYKNRAKKEQPLTEWERAGGAPPCDYDSYMARADVEFKKYPGLYFRVGEDGVERNCKGQTREEFAAAHDRMVEETNRRAMERFRKKQQEAKAKKQEANAYA